MTRLPLILALLAVGCDKPEVKMPYEGPPIIMGINMDDPTGEKSRTTYVYDDRWKQEGCPKGYARPWVNGKPVGMCMKVDPDAPWPPTPSAASPSAR